MTATRQGHAGALVQRDAVVRWALGTTLVATAVLVVVLLAGGGAPQPVPAGLPDAGLLTGWGLPIVKLASDYGIIVALLLRLSDTVRNQPRLVV